MMSVREADRLQRIFEWLPGAAALLVTAIGSAAMIGWLTGEKVLASWISSGPAMKFNAALIFTVSGIALWVLRSPEVSDLRREVGHALAMFVMVMGLSSLVQHHFDVAIGLDRLFYSGPDLFPEPVPVSWASHPGRFSPIGGWLSVMMALSLILIDYKTRSRRCPGQYFSVTLGVVGTIAVLAYVFDVREFYALSLYTRLALPAGVALIAFAAGAILGRPNQGLARILVSQRSGGFLARHLIPTSTISIALIGWLSWVGCRHGLYSDPYAFAIFLTAALFVILFLAWRNSEVLDVMDFQRSAAEILARRGEERLALAFDAASMGLWDWDLITDKMEVSDIFARIFDVDKSAVRTNRSLVTARILPEDLEAARLAMSQAERERRDFALEYRIRLNDGSVRWVASRGRTFSNSQGSPRRVIGVVIDVTENKKIEEKLNEAARRANEASEAKSAFLANMSHEIRTPLGAILGFTELLRDPGVPTEEKATYFETIQRNGEQLSNLINDILDLSKVEAGQFKVEVLKTFPRKLVSDVFSILEQKARQKGLALASHFDPSVPELIGTDPTRLKQILMNIVGNAIKFTSSGSVDLEVREIKTGDIEFRVTDTGIGISEDQVARLFQPFSQADESTTRQYGGTGLGLVLSKKLAQALGGDLKVESSKIGVGSVFIFTVENRGALETSPGSSVPLARSMPVVSEKDDYRGLKALLVDDSPDNRQFIARMLTRMGLEVETAENGLEGVNKALAGEYALIFMDLQMPVMDGYTATEKLRERGYMKPIIALSAHAMEEARARSLAAGCNDKLTKPVNKEALLAIIAHYVKSERFGSEAVH